MALSCIIGEIERDIGQKLQFFTPPSIRRLRKGGPRRSTAIPFGVEKIDWYG